MWFLHFARISGLFALMMKMPVYQARFHFYFLGLFGCLAGVYLVNALKNRPGNYSGNISAEIGLSRARGGVCTRVRVVLATYSNVTSHHTVYPIWYWDGLSAPYLDCFICPYLDGLCKPPSFKMGFIHLYSDRCTFIRWRCDNLYQMWLSIT